MRGGADGGGSQERGNVKKRDLDDALRDGLGARGQDTKRRRTPGHAHHVDEHTRDSSNFNCSTQDVKKNSIQKTSNSWMFLSGPSGLRPLQTQHSSRQPSTVGSAPEASGASRALRASEATKPARTKGIFSAPDHHKLKLDTLRNGPPTSSSTSSDTSLIPARFTETLPASSKGLPTSSLQSLRYGFSRANRTAAGEGNSLGKDRPGQVGHSHNTGHLVLSQGRQTGTEDKALPSHHIKGKKKQPYDYDPSDDDSYVDNDGDSVDDVDEKLPSTRQGSARMKARIGSGEPSSNGYYDNLDNNHGTRPVSYDKTPSGKDYHEYPDQYGTMHFTKFVLFPDNYSLRPMRGSGSLPFGCPSSHKRSEFNDNLDEEGTLEFVRSRLDSEPGTRSIIVSQNPRHPPSLTHQTFTFRRTRENEIVKPTDVETTTANSTGSRGYDNVPSKAWTPPDLQHSSPLASDDQDNQSTTSLNLETSMAESKVWAYVSPLVPRTWTASVTDELETKAFIQAISLPLRNKLDEAWLEGTKRSHQRIYRALMSVIIQAIGVKAQCKPCELKSPERQRNCKILPPEAKGMRELQEVCGSQCVNCYFFQATKPCEFPASTSMTKQTPIPVPVPSVMRLPQNTERVLAPPPTSHRPAPPTVSRPQDRSYSSYKATVADKPISESPVPVPLFANRGPTPLVQVPFSSNVSLDNPKSKMPRRSERIIKTYSDFFNNIDIADYHTDEADSHPTSSAVSIAGTSKTTLTSRGSGARESTTVASTLSRGELSISQLLGKAFSLFGEISQLPGDEQATVWHKIQQMAGMLETGRGTATRASNAHSTSPSLLPFSSALAEEWEIAPGRLMAGDKQLALSTSFLNREINEVKLQKAHQLSPTQSVLNKSIAALDQLSIRPEDNWNCACSVIKGVLKMKVGDVEAGIGQGGVILIEEECILMNVLHKEARIQVWWTRTDD
ncbi:hypothetical protein J7T55_004600 [Diaporthe amygdali]|uniref:uncharacterized protein n=1 Tax=Phomopsis amygdali TaxID=1214568 RepID=UPI0022FDEEA6|nr:uncharacterized protein J7T55_004600 [Diaporthe amygdali]KAJ0114858.1 hypothetical protein J7T55_004600 [Diaporthe amygdali]